MPEDEHYSLTELADLAGVTPRTVRYYLAQGLLPAVGQTGPGAKYDDRHLARLRLIRRLQTEHLPLAEIRRRLDGLDRGRDPRARRTGEPEPPTRLCAGVPRSVLGVRSSPGGRAAPATGPGTAAADSDDRGRPPRRPADHEPMRSPSPRPTASSMPGAVRGPARTLQPPAFRRASFRPCRSRARWSARSGIASRSRPTSSSTSVARWGAPSRKGSTASSRSPASSSRRNDHDRFDRHDPERPPRPSSHPTQRAQQALPAGSRSPRRARRPSGHDRRSTWPSSSTGRARCPVRSCASRSWPSRRPSSGCSPTTASASSSTTTRWTSSSSPPPHRASRVAARSSGCGPSRRVAARTWARAGCAAASRWPATSPSWASTAACS